MNPREKLSIFLFLSLFFVANANTALLTPHEIHLAQEFKTSILAIDFILFLFMAASALSLPFWGYFCDRAGKDGRKYLLFFGTALWCLPSLFIYATSSYLVFLVARVLTGMGIAVIYPVSFSIFTDYVAPQMRGKALASIPVILGLGAGAGVILASAFGEFAWRPPFLLLGLIGLFFTVLSLFFLHEPKRGVSEPELKELILSGKTYSHSINMQKLMNSLKIKTNQWLILSSIPWAIPLGIFSFKFMPYLEFYGFDPGIKTIVFILMGSGLVFGYLLGGFAGDWAENNKFGRLLVSSISLLIGIVFLSIGWAIPRSGMLWSFNTIIFFLLVFFGLLFASLNVANISALLGSVNEPETRGILFSILNSFSYLGMGIGVLMGGIGIEATLESYRSILFWGAQIYVLSILCWVPISETLGKDSKRIRDIMAQRAEEMAN